MNKVVINIKTDLETKKASQAIANDLGLSLSALINTQLKQLIHHRRLVLDAPYPVMEIDAKTEKELDQVYKEISQGKVSQPFDSVEELLKDLNS